MSTSEQVAVVFGGDEVSCRLNVPLSIIARAAECQWVGKHVPVSSVPPFRPLSFPPNP